MRSTKVAARYAKSLIDLSIEQNKLEDTYQDLCLIHKICEENRDFELLLASPIVKSDKKAKIIDAVFAGQITEITAGFIKIILSRRREYLLNDIAASFILKYKAYKNILIAEVTTAVPMTEAVRTQVMEVVKTLAHDSIELNEHVDPDLIGGLVLRVGDNQIDASVSKKLNELRKEFSRNPYVAEF